MAHFAKIGADNKVIAVYVCGNADTETDGGLEKEEIGAAFLQAQYGGGEWKQCSYNTSKGQHLHGGTAFRANYPGPGWTYDSSNDIFVQPRPTDRYGELCASWTVNTTTGMYDPPISRPTGDGDGTSVSTYKWDEAAYQADNTKGWIQIDS